MALARLIMHSGIVKTQTTDTLLINMPFGPLFRPSLPLSLLKAKLASLKISVQVVYFTIPFAERLGMKLYARISNGQPRLTDLLGEFLFCRSLYDESSNRYAEEVLMKRNDGQEQLVSEDFIRQLPKLESLAEIFIEECCEKILQLNPKVIVFSSYLQQQISSLALAKKINARAPETSILFFGNNCNSVMGAELIRQFPFVSAVISGEVDDVLPTLVQKILAEESLPNLQGVYTAESIDSMFKKEVFSNTVPITDMDSLPFPDFDDFIEQHKISSLDKKAKKQLMFETARGCWWGERSHCSFCGLNSESMFFRSKSPHRALQEVVHLAEKYPGTMISAVDNILDMKYFKNFVPELATKELNLELFYEVKANLNKEQVRMLRAAGITRVQPGIESFSSTILKLMGKGVKGLQNIQLLKWCKEYGIRPFWNILFGFPGEDPEEYFKMAELIPLLTHLPAPESLGQIRIERFSPNYKYPDQLGFKNVKPYSSYSHIYPFAEEVVANLSYFFTYDYKVPRNVGEYIRPLYDQVLNWKQSSSSSDLFFVENENSLFICDLRPIAQTPVTTICSLQKVLYLACDSVTTIEELKKILETHSNAAVSTEDVEKLLNPMISNGLMVSENNTYLSLAIRLGEFSTSKAAKKVRELCDSVAT